MGQDSNDISNGVIDELNQKLAQLESAEGWFVTVTLKDGERLSHWQGCDRFPEHDRINSLHEIMKLVGGNRKQRRRLHLVKPRKYD